MDSNNETLDVDVLVVDDEAMIRELLVRVLSGECKSVTTADSGSAAIEYLATHEVQLVITDLRMPGKNGIDVLRAARERFPDIGLIVISGFVERADELVIESLGAQLLRKPFNPTALCDTVRSLVATR